MPSTDRSASSSVSGKENFDADMKASTSSTSAASGEKAKRIPKPVSEQHIVVGKGPRRKKANARRPINRKDHEKKDYLAEIKLKKEEVEKAEKARIAAETRRMEAPRFVLDIIEINEAQTPSPSTSSSASSTDGQNESRDTTPEPECDCDHVTDSVPDKIIEEPTQEDACSEPVQPEQTMDESVRIPEDDTVQVIQNRCTDLVLFRSEALQYSQPHHEELEVSELAHHRDSFGSNTDSDSYSDDDASVVNVYAEDDTTEVDDDMYEEKRPQHVDPPTVDLQEAQDSKLVLYDAAVAAVNIEVRKRDRQDDANWGAGELPWVEPETLDALRQHRFQGVDLEQLIPSMPPFADVASEEFDADLVARVFPNLPAWANTLSAVLDIDRAEVYYYETLLALADLDDTDSEFEDSIESEFEEDDQPASGHHLGPEHENEMGNDDVDETTSSYENDIEMVDAPDFEEDYGVGDEFDRPCMTPAAFRAYVNALLNKSVPEFPMPPRRPLAITYPSVKGDAAMDNLEDVPTPAAVRALLEFHAAPITPALLLALPLNSNICAESIAAGSLDEDVQEDVEVEVDTPDQVYPLGEFEGAPTTPALLLGLPNSSVDSRRPEIARPLGTFENAPTTPARLLTLPNSHEVVKKAPGASTDEAQHPDESEGAPTGENAPEAPVARPLGEFEGAPVAPEPLLALPVSAAEAIKPMIASAKTQEQERKNLPTDGRTSQFQAQVEDSSAAIFSSIGAVLNNLGKATGTGAIVDAPKIPQESGHVPHPTNQASKVAPNNSRKVAQAQNTFLGTISLADFLRALHVEDAGTTHRNDIIETFARMSAMWKNFLGIDDDLPTFAELQDPVVQCRTKLGNKALWDFLNDIEFDEDGETSIVNVAAAFRKAARDDNKPPSSQLAKLLELEAGLEE